MTIFSYFTDKTNNYSFKIFLYFELFSCDQILISSMSLAISVPQWHHSVRARNKHKNCLEISLFFFFVVFFLFFAHILSYRLERSISANPDFFFFFFNSSKTYYKRWKKRVIPSWWVPGHLSCVMQKSQLQRSFKRCLCLPFRLSKSPRN